MRRLSVSGLSGVGLVLTGTLRIKNLKNTNLFLKGRWNKSPAACFGVIKNDKSASNSQKIEEIIVPREHNIDLHEDIQGYSDQSHLSERRIEHQTTYYLGLEFRN